MKASPTLSARHPVADLTSEDHEIDAGVPRNPPGEGLFDRRERNQQLGTLRTKRGRLAFGGSQWIPAVAPMAFARAGSATPMIPMRTPPTVSIRDGTTFLAPEMLLATRSGANTPIPA